MKAKAVRPSKAISLASFRISFKVSTEAFATALPVFIPYFAPGFFFSYSTTFVVHSPGRLLQVFGSWLKRDTWEMFISSSSSSSSTSSASPEVSDVSAKGFPLQTSCNCPKISEIPEYDWGQSWDNFVAKEQAVFRAPQPRSSLSQSASSCKAFGSSAHSSGSLAWTCNQAVWSHCSSPHDAYKFGHNASKKRWKAQNAMPLRRPCFGALLERQHWMPIAGQVSWGCKILAAKCGAKNHHPRRSSRNNHLSPRSAPYIKVTRDMAPYITMMVDSPKNKRKVCSVKQTLSYMIFVIVAPSEKKCGL